jgi:hypothetical protein
MRRFLLDTGIAGEYVNRRAPLCKSFLYCAIAWTARGLSRFFTGMRTLIRARQSIRRRNPARPRKH